jgi:hypothetical protein
VRRALVAVLSLLAVTACGPTLPLNTGLTTRGLNVFFGAPASPAPFVPNGNPLPNFPAPLEIAPGFPLPAISTPVACASASPTTYPALAADATPRSLPPAAGIYPFRFTGSETETGRSRPLPTIGFRQVIPGKVSTDPAGNQSYTFQVNQLYGGQSTSMSFLVEPQGPGSVVVGALAQVQSPAAGLYLTGMTDDSGNHFTPATPIQLMPFPASAGLTYPSAGWEEGSGTDPATATTMSIQSGTIVGRERVDACGTVLDSWRVEVKGDIDSATGHGCPAGSTSCGQQKSFTLDFDDATQYGGLIIFDHLLEDGVDQTNGNKFHYDIAATINQKPAEPHQ